MKNFYLVVIVFGILLSFLMGSIVFSHDTIHSVAEIQENGNILERKVDLIYQYFSENQKGDMIINRGYQFSESFQEKNRYITEYNSLKEKLIEIFEDPTEDQMIWESNGYQGMQPLWGYAISQGKLKLITVLEMQNESIKMILYGHDYQIK